VFAHFHIQWTLWSCCRLLPPRPIAKLLVGSEMTGAGDGNRTHVRSLGSFYSAIELRPLRSKRIDYTKTRRRRDSPAIEWHTQPTRRCRQWSFVRRHKVRAERAQASTGIEDRH
jgi:hypothetical protein